MTEEIQFKDIKFGLTNLGQIDATVGRDGWSISNLNDMQVERPDVLYKPRSLATPDNTLDLEYVRFLNFKLNYRDNYAGNLTIREYNEYMFIYDMELESEYRGMGGGGLFMDLFKASIIFSGKDLAGGFVGDGNTLQFLKHNGFSRADFETWTDHVWEINRLGGKFASNKNYYNIPEDDRFGLTPTASDIKEAFDQYVIEAAEDSPRVRRDVAKPFWEGGWSTWFRIPTRQIEFEENVFPLTDRSAPVLDRFRDPTTKLLDFER